MRQIKELLLVFLFLVLFSPKRHVCQSFLQGCIPSGSTGPSHRSAPTGKTCHLVVGVKGKAAGELTVL